MSKNYQGGKSYGALMKDQEEKLDEINKRFFNSGDYDDKEDYPDLQERLESYKKQFMEFDEDHSGEIGNPVQFISRCGIVLLSWSAVYVILANLLDIMKLKRTLEKLGQAKTHLELKEMIAEVDMTNSGTIYYDEFVTMMLGKKSLILKIILMFEEKKKEKERPKGVAPKRDLASLP